ncbi:proprotein convertase P-domain-containing protein [Nitrococcus mobilis]|uniref:Putative zinc metalloendopeptidase n=1 Tax=Nitrococcus mobilis Nb-231 TaxID=314278 RepID=A4BQY6_9GAMM|nr:proprotein convertase P-domain-containing protein [Nitrococcus mobilis]EAR21986.1 putative zinc metalloendopeptidase [Nitrococcus mobilis Nb-231]
MRHEFVNEQPVAIHPGPPGKIQSEIAVSDLEQATVENLEVHVDINHTWTGDLRIKLYSPDGTEVLLVNRRGGFRNDFRNTIFRANAQISITDGQPPFRGTFRPEGDFLALRGKAVQGSWTLEVEDMAEQDGGALNRWSLGLDTDVTETSPFAIEVRFLGGLSPAQQSAFAQAAQRWAQIIRGDLPSAVVDGITIDDVLIEAEGVSLDGPGGILGQAGPTHVRPGSNLPVKGIMSFDTADLDRMEVDNSLIDVILHEMGHVLGFGTLWSHMDLIVGAGTVNPVFVGANARREYAVLTSRPSPTAVPVENTGGSGTRDGHWRESVFGHELLTGFLSGVTRPISRMSVGAFEDMGYEVDYEAADEFVIPSALFLAELGIMGDRSPMNTCIIRRPKPVVLPPTAVLNR